MKSAFDIYYDYAMRLVGVPYKWGGSNPISGIDCSGLAQELASVLGVDPKDDQTAVDLFHAFRIDGTICLKKDFKRGLDHPALKIGAFAFYGSSLANITHVACLLNSWLAIGANGGGSKVTDRNLADEHDAFVKIRPIDYRPDLLAVVLPKYPDFVL